MGNLGISPGMNMPDSRRSGLMYASSHIDDNFPLKTNVDQTQFGFLPTILKSFQ